MLFATFVIIHITFCYVFCLVYGNVLMVIVFVIGLFILPLCYYAVVCFTLGGGCVILCMYVVFSSLLFVNF